jgi:hypothetical protein
MTPEKFLNFPDLKSVLRYLQLCVHTIIVDFMRAREKADLMSADSDSLAEKEPAGQSIEDQALAQAQREELWRWLDERMHTEKERRVIYATFVLALKPREVFNQYRSLFRDVDEVYLVKENVLARLRRDEGLKKFLRDA